MSEQQSTQHQINSTNASSTKGPSLNQAHSASEPATILQKARGSPRRIATAVGAAALIGVSLYAVAPRKDTVDPRSVADKVDTTAVVGGKETNRHPRVASHMAEDPDKSEGGEKGIPTKNAKTWGSKGNTVLGHKDRTQTRA